MIKLCASWGSKFRCGDNIATASKNSNDIQIYVVTKFLFKYFKP